MPNRVSPYDALDRQVSRTGPLGQTWAFEYDPRYLRTAVIKPDGTRVAFVYDNRGRLTAATVAGQAAAARNYTYDAADNLTAATAATGTPDVLGQLFTYNNRDELTRARQSVSSIGAQYDFNHTYDALGRRTLTSDTGGARTSYAYDLADRLTAVTAPSGKVIALDYDSAGRRTKVRYPNGLNTEALFETSTATGTGTTGRLASIAHGLNALGEGGSSLNLKLGTAAYGYDVKGNIIAANENGTTPRNRAYTLDAIERLTLVKDGSGATLESYTLDEEGNRITSHLASFNVTDIANRLTEDEKHQFEYDANGNMVRKTVKATGATWRYSYTVWYELASASRHLTCSPECTHS